MCGRFAQYSSRDEYSEALGLKPEEIKYDHESSRCYNVAPGTKVMLLNECEGDLHFDPVFWKYSLKFTLQFSRIDDFFKKN